MMNRAPGLFTECRHIVAQGGPQKFREWPRLEKQ